ncbi:hypothetical protein [Botrimarina mediterranea]|uniref:hypothetical protein n=1 Tax=Botrimarina mediterranea TaxID=2528022 RepID=UPI0011A1226C|nr:hypothetical protein [Botrimarina mediterranea]
MKENQAIVWLSIDGGYSQKVPRRDCAIFPAILDTGFNADLVMSEIHFDKWSHRDDPGYASDGGECRVNGEKFYCLQGQAFLYRQELANGAPNKHGTISPIKLKLKRGLAIKPKPPLPNALAVKIGIAKPGRDIPLPLIGLGCITENHLRLILDGYDQHFQIESRHAT